MNYKTDLHIHTVSSGHAYSTVDEIIRESLKKELKVIAITDHNSGLPGGAHDFHFQNLKVIPKQVGDLTILKGMEANIIDFNGNIDCNEEMAQALDLVIASLHPPCIPFGEKEEVTKTVEKVMEIPYVKILGHPGDARYPLDAKRVVEASRRTGTLIEINGASLKPQSFRPGVRENLKEILDYCKRLEVSIIINTDAHICYDVGEFTEAYAFMKEIDFPENLILNTDPKRLLEHLSDKH